MYRTLNTESITATMKRLQHRISERFPGSGLSRVAAELLAETESAAVTARWLVAPLPTIRVVSGLIISGMLALAVATLVALRKAELFSTASDFLQGVDAGVNELIVIGAAAYFLVGLETRIKRTRALRAIHALRSLAHVIDMHQLTKDPERLGTGDDDTPSSPVRTMNAFELTRYLDYCSEMLSIISKVAALYAQGFHDSVTLGAVDEVEGLTGALSQKMWQKILILNRDPA